MQKLLFVTLILAAGCIGVDEVDDPIVGAKIVAAEEQVALLLNTTAQLNAEYFDPYGIKREVQFIWTSSNSEVAVVNGAGVVVGRKIGQAVVQPSLGSVVGPLINVNVVPDPNTVAKVQITSPKTGMMVGEFMQLHILITNLANDQLTGKTVEWFSENNSILTVNESGGVVATGSGIAAVHAKVDGVKSNSIDIKVGGKVGTFVKAGGYEAKGTATLVEDGTNLILTLKEDFATSFALGTFIYLSNSTNGTVVRSTGLEVAQITTNGLHSFVISNVGINDYKYVIVLCKPASVLFGFAEMK